MTNPTCYFHPDDEAVGVMLIGLDEVPACVTDLVETIEEGVYDVDFYTDVPHDQGEGAVLAELARRDHELLEAVAS